MASRNQKRAEDEPKEKDEHPDKKTNPKVPRTMVKSDVPSLDQEATRGHSERYPQNSYEISSGNTMGQPRTTANTAARDFGMVPRGNYPALIKMIYQNPDYFQRSCLDELYQSAIAALRINDRSSAKRFVDRCVILNKCPKGDIKYLFDLNESYQRNGRTYSHHDEECERVLEALKQRLSSTTREHGEGSNLMRHPVSAGTQHEDNPRRSGSLTIPPTSTPQTVSYTQPTLKTQNLASDQPRPPRMGRSSDSSVVTPQPISSNYQDPGITPNWNSRTGPISGQPGPDSSIIPPMDRLKITSNTLPPINEGAVPNPYTLETRQNPTSFDPRPSTGAKPPKHGGQEGFANLRPSKDGISVEGSFDLYGDRFDYQVRRDGPAFYVPGRVFLVIWSTPAGADTKGQRNPGVKVFSGPYKSQFFAEPTYMLVVVQQKGYAICCPISTYKGKGLTKGGLPLEAIRAHAIIYSDGSTPYQLEGEPELRKEPIKVKMEPKRKALDKASRVHFGKPITIECNVPVAKIGKVEGKYLDRALSYFWDEFDSYHTSGSTQASSEQSRRRRRM